MIISFEGLDKSGKTTAASRLYKLLKNEAGVDVELLREPGTTELGEYVRCILSRGDVEPWTEVYLLSAARSSLIDERIRPALERGAVVLCDRFFDSTLVYQGCRGLQEQEIWNAIKCSVSGFRPMLTLLFDVSVEEAIERGLGEDGIEQRGKEFYTKVRESYLTRAMKDSLRWRVIDAGQGTDEVFEQVKSAIQSVGVTGLV